MDALLCRDCTPPARQQQEERVIPLSRPEDASADRAQGWQQTPESFQEPARNEKREDHEHSDISLLDYPEGGIVHPADQRTRTEDTREDRGSVMLSGGGQFQHWPKAKQRRR